MPLNVQITFLYSPPSAPAAGSPIIVLSAIYYGPSEDAEKAATKLFEVILVGKVLKALTPQAIKESFAKWAQVMEQPPDAARTSVVFYKFSPDKLRTNGNMKGIENRFLEGRDRGSTAMALTWCVAPASRDRLVDFVDEFFNTCRCAGGVPPKTFANTMRLRVNLDELFQEEKVEELQRVRER
ncbi:FAD linked oxidase [Fusarium falciforme]|uniref:FAD linked oxidase n=1 Tax=Fusarium falciforme TaxID=195108 RepID=UPI0023014C44|nr:FAD linked oxidase [Fusarium falciforme]WAO90152.1 FAD linked oxidase [Fusarium falciforme]